MFSNVSCCSGSIAVLQLVAASLGNGEAMTHARLVALFLAALFLFLAVVF